jgi:NAD(P)-dependent dehydrogenase (short-subunit alcohol dehydrogenase family)
MASDQGAGHPRPDGKPHAASRDAGARLDAERPAGAGPRRFRGLRLVYINKPPNDRRRELEYSGRIVMPSNDIKGTTALVTGASRGFGRGIAAALDGAGAAVVGVARDGAALEELRAELGDSFTPVSADAADPTVAGQLIDAYRPGILVLNAGAAPLSRPLQHHTWQTFSRNWDVDVKQVFHWLREALLVPLAPGSTVITMSSGAALRGSPLSGGYAGSKATIRFITSYAAAESERGGLGIRFISVLPQLTPATALGGAAVAAYAAREGMDVAAYLERSGPALTPGQAGEAFVALASDPGHAAGPYLLTAGGLSPVT